MFCVEASLPKDSLNGLFLSLSPSSPLTQLLYHVVCRFSFSHHHQSFRWTAPHRTAAEGLQLLILVNPCTMLLQGANPSELKVALKARMDALGEVLSEQERQQVRVREYVYVFWAGIIRKDWIMQTCNYLDGGYAGCRNGRAGRLS